MDPAPAELTPRTRVVLLGASNLALYLPRVIAAARAAFDGPLEVLAAAGLGRSYGGWSRVLRRELPGIREAGLWTALRDAHAERPLPTVALLVDVGNDLVYGTRAEEVAGWVATCLERLAAVDARTTLALLPMPSVEALGSVRFGLVRAVLFPRHRVHLDDVRREARALQERLRALAAERRASAVEQDGDWYGLDPIHVRPRRAARAWSTVLAAWDPAAAGKTLSRAALPPSALSRSALSRSERTRVRRARAALRRVGGRTLHSAQPAARLDDGSTLALY